MIGVYEGNDPYDDGRSWRQKCGNEDPGKCRRRLKKLKAERGGVVFVDVSITDRPVILALSGYDKIKWFVKAAPGVQIDKVVLSGYHAQSVEGISPQTPVEVYTHDESPCKANCSRGDKSFFSYRSPPAQLQQIVGLQPASWQGSYTGEKFSIHPGLETEVRVSTATETAADKARKEMQTKALNRRLPKKMLNENYAGQFLENVDFNGRLVSKTTFDGANLKGASFKGVESFQFLSFKDADLSGADFSQVTISRVDFSGANLSGANFSGIFCSDCRFDRADLTGARFDQAGFNNVSFDSAELQNASFSAQIWYSVDFTGARNLDHDQIYRLRKANPGGVGNIIYDYQGCSIGGAFSLCRSADLSGHRFFASEISGADFSRANLSNADFSLARVVNSNFSEANLSAAVFGKIVVQNDFSGANLSGANFLVTRLQGNDFTRARLDDLQFTPSLVNPSLFANADLDGCAQCQAHLEFGEIDFDQLVQQISAVGSSYSGVNSTNQAYIKLASSRKYAAFLTGRANLALDQYAAVLRTMLRSSEPLLQIDALFTVDQITTRSRSHAICQEPKLVAAMLPLIRLSDESIDARARDRKLLPGRTASEHIRLKSAACLVASVERFEPVARAFQEAYQVEPVLETRRLLMKGYHSDRPFLENLLISELDGGEVELAKQAAIYLGDRHLPSPALVSALLRFFQSENGVDMQFYDLLNSYVPVGVSDLERFRQAARLRKSKSWKTYEIDKLIRKLARHLG